MRIIYTAPQTSSYHDNKTWFPTGTHPNGGIWLEAGDCVAVVTANHKNGIDSEFLKIYAGLDIDLEPAKETIDETDPRWDWRLD